MIKNIVLLGATGSIGDSTLKVLRKNPQSLKLVGIAGYSRWKELAEIAREFSVLDVGLFDEERCAEAKNSGLFSPETRWYAGAQGLRDLAVLPDAHTVVMAVVGTAGLLPTLDAIKNGKTIALASKEVLVKAGKFVMAAVRKHKVNILPVDSEHNALYQCMHGHPREHVDKLILTASGGAFLNKRLCDLQHISPQDALKHPNWKMGPKVTIDSSTMANKGLELIEAHWLYDMPAERLNVVIHPQSIVHSMVQYVDGTILAHLSPPCMTFPIQHCLLYPERAEGVRATLDFSTLMQLEFRPADPQRFACLRLAQEALRHNGVAPAIFNAANEIAVEAFIHASLPYLRIPNVIEETLESAKTFEPTSLEDVLDADLEARRIANKVVLSYIRG